ncbi:CRISPR-associated helicase/endonuclease Cas3 [Deinococcus arcticus]|uniref:CRISPR-associated helicase/endonuclease Cas3 n=1 Tax=Deinococcus arcticus TaxID=2136176 RepID=A0A2T3W9K5_9DEIO|nr:CRISPR-associated helicase/endonuclease Cas3 [Deinococcus arcticus]PTA68502.1 CRISPR-associated helicase/endonuclease Cas3 [Deinococcus arcticus]
MDRATQQAWYLWAKSDRRGDGKPGDGRYLPVLTHLLDVAACTWEILELEPPRTLALLAEDYGLDVDMARRWVCALAGLHDLGKASPTFQALWDMAEKRPLAGVERLVAGAGTTNVPHGEVSQLLLSELLQKVRWSRSVAERVADAVGCHHGRPTSRQGLQIPTHERGGGDWEMAQRTLFKKVLQAVGVRTAPALTDLSAPAYMRLAGLTSFADWVGSSFEVPAQVDPLPMLDPAAYFEKARGKARDKLEKIGWTRREPLQPGVQAPAEMFAYLPGFVPRALQEQLAAILPTLSAEPTLILVEAPMGEGKTEAGLHAATWLQTKLGHRGLYVALPTQATGNAMYTRFRRFLHEASQRDIEPDLQLMHGGALLNEAYQESITRTLNPQNDSATADEARLNVRAESWFSARKRAGLSEYGVGTVDQALLGVLGIPHQFVRLWGLGNRVVLLDEIHAYDTYTSHLIYALLRWLKALSSSVILMSATLPAASRRQLLDAWTTREEGETAPYPRLTVAQGTQARSQHIASSRTQTPITVRALGASVEEVAQKALDLAVDGGCVAVIVNTVQRAQDVFSEIQARHVGRLRTVLQGGTKEDLCAILFHARYPAEDRGTRETAVLRYLGPQPYENRELGVQKADYRPRRLILIATQVAEQSLDFDADVMISDLAPVDLLLQRAGRLHRHAGNAGRRHGHGTPNLWVAGLDTWPAAAMETLRWQWVYAPHLLYRTWLRLKDGGQIRLPADLDTLVQDVYGEGEWFTLEDDRRAQLDAATAKFLNQQDNEGRFGDLAHIGNPESFFNTVPVVRPEPDGEPAHDDEWPQTRLGEQNVRLVPVHEIGSGYFLDPEGKKPARIGRGVGKLDRAQAAAIFKRSLRVSRRELVHRAPDLAPPHASWTDDPLLRDSVPLPLVNRKVTVGNLEVELDPELGLVYRSVSSES